MYEGYGPHGVAFMVETATDNRQRTVAAVKNIFDRYGGTMGGVGAVAYLFKRVGVIVVSKAPQLTFDMIIELALNAGAEDVIERTDEFEIFTEVASLMNVKQALEAQSVVLENAEIIMHPLTPMSVPDNHVSAVTALEEALGELDDVQRVYTNMQ